MRRDGDPLGGISIFADLTGEERGAVAALMGERHVAQGQLVCAEGQPGEELYVVLSGRVAVTVSSQAAGEVVLGEMRAGDFFGEMSIVEQAPRSASCRAMEDSTLVALHARDFHLLIDTRPTAAIPVLRRMAAIAAERLGSTGALVSQMVQFGERARRRAVTDDATGLFNRRFYDDTLEDIVRRAELDSSPLGLAMFDLDRFGDLNKSYGQVFCDGIIVESSRAFRRVFGEKDILVRYGGDEFTFVLPGRDTADALRMCRAVNEEIRRLRFTEHPELRLTCSIGLAVYPLDARTPAALKEQADRALYRAKELGRDRTETLDVAP